VEHLSLESLEEGEGTDPLGAEWLLGGSGAQPGCTYRTITLTDGTEIKADGEVMPPGHLPGRCRYWQGRLTSGAWTMRRTGLSS
jgi:hypothetical protein